MLMIDTRMSQSDALAGRQAGMVEIMRED